MTEPTAERARPCQRQRQRQRQRPAPLCAWLLGVSTALTALAGCFNLPKFSAYSLVDRPRILAVVADPPELQPGAGARLSVLVAGAKDVTEVSWRACSLSSLFAGGGGTQFGNNTSDRGCPGVDALPEQGEQVSLPGEKTAEQFFNLGLVASVLGGDLPPQALEEIRQSVGVALTVEADVMADGKLLRALKRVLISENKRPGTNPPAPTFRFDQQLVRGLADPAQFRCEPADGQLTARPGAQVALEPVFDGDEEPWLEQYVVRDARGTLGQRKEQAFYSWFTSQGRLAHATTEAPDRANVWYAPEQPGCAQLWLVVRDGHGGESACGVSVSVGGADACGDGG